MREKERERERKREKGRKRFPSLPLVYSVADSIPLSAVVSVSL